jgi:hypothetical protein
VKKLLISITVAILAATPSYAATSKPTPKPTTKATTKATASKKPTVSISKKATTSRKKYVYRPRAKVSLSPSPKPVWPPNGFKEDNGVYALIPTGSQLVSLLSAKKTLASVVRQCEADACGAVYVASITDCTYWEVNAIVSGPSYSDITQFVEYGKIRTLVKGTSAKTVTPIFLISTETLIPNEDVILKTLGISKDKFYTQISQGKSLRQISGDKITQVVKAVTAAEKNDINDRLDAKLISASQAQDQLDALPSRVSNELTAYNLTVGSVNVKCWISSPTDPVPSTVYTPTASRW